MIISTRVVLIFRLLVLRRTYLCHLEQMYMSRGNIGGKFRSLTVKSFCLGTTFWHIPIMYVLSKYSKNVCPLCGIIVFQKNQHPPSPSYLLTEILSCRTYNETLKISHLLYVYFKYLRVFCGYDENILFE